MSVAAPVALAVVLVFSLHGCHARPAAPAAPASATSRALLLDPDDPEWRREAPPVSHLRFETTKGVFVLELVRAWGPIGADRLYNLAQLAPGHPNTRNTEIYVNLADNVRNDAEPFTVLGRVVEGMDVLDALYSGYGETSGGGVRQGHQGPLLKGGNAYIDREYPGLDRIVRVTVTPVPRP